MTNENAKDAIERMWADGLKPTVEDIIRLNAIACKCKAAVAKVSTKSYYYLPRVAQISDTISFRQPAIGHEVWLAKVERLIEPTFETILAVRAFALSRPPSALPDADDPNAVKEAVETFAATCADFTRDQLTAAIIYVIYGPDANAGEYAAKADDADDEDERIPDGTDEQDWKLCVAVGVLHEAKAVLFGVSQAELETMTRKQVDDLMRGARGLHGIGTNESNASAYEDYYNTRDEIRARLERERDAAKAVAENVASTEAEYNGQHD